MTDYSIPGVKREEHSSHPDPPTNNSARHTGCGPRDVHIINIIDQKGVRQADGSRSTPLMIGWPEGRTSLRNIPQP